MGGKLWLSLSHWLGWPAATATAAAHAREANCTIYARQDKWVGNSGSLSLDWLGWPAATATAAAHAREANCTIYARQDKWVGNSGSL